MDYSLARNSKTDQAQATDEELIRFAQAGDYDAVIALLFRYKRLVSFICRSYFLMGADREDLMQEASIGLYKAIRDFNPMMQCSFRQFAQLCIKRQVITAVKTATRQKHMLMNSCISLDHEIYQDGHRTLLDHLTDPADNNPEQAFIIKENLKTLRETLAVSFSALELRALNLYLQHHSYRQIAQSLGVSEKCITNCMYRVQKKLKRMDNR